MEDLIDFPCSPDWLEYYHLRGLTLRRPVREQTEAGAELRAIREGLETLTTTLTKLLERLSAEPVLSEPAGTGVSELAARVARLERQLEALSRAVRSREAERPVGDRPAAREEKPKKERRSVHVAEV
jgi:hypothetical protein